MGSMTSTDCDHQQQEEHGELQQQQDEAPAQSDQAAQTAEDGAAVSAPDGEMSGPVDVFVSRGTSVDKSSKDQDSVQVDPIASEPAAATGQEIVKASEFTTARDDLEDEDPRLDPLANCYPWVPQPRRIDIEAAGRIKPDRLLNMLPFKVWTRHSMIGAELDNGPSRVWLTKHPLTSNDFALDPDRVAKASITWHRFLRCTFFNTILGSISVIIATCLAMYISVLTLSVNTDEPVSKYNFGMTVSAIISVFVFVYPLVTSWMVLSIAFEQMMRREIYYVLLHYKIIIDFQNSSWTFGKKFANCPFNSFFLWWIVVGAIVIITWTFSISTNYWENFAICVLSTVPMYLWWSTVTKQEWSFIPINKFFEMKRDAGEGMDLQTGLDYLKDCTVVPEMAFRALAAHLPAGQLSGLFHDICPMPLFIYNACYPSEEEPVDPTPEFLEKLREQGRLWWEQRASYDPHVDFPPDESRARKTCFMCSKTAWAESRWASVFMAKVLPFTSDLWELRRLINQYNCWTGSTWVVTMWIVFGLEILVAIYFTLGEGSEPLATPTPTPTPLPM